METVLVIVVVTLAVALVALAAWGVARSGPFLLRIHRRRLERAAARAGFVERLLTLGPDTVQLWEGGAGPTVVLVHGFGGDALWQWVPLMRALVVRFRVIVPNLLWFGDSRSSRPDRSLDHQLRALLATLDHLGERQVDLVGLSYGGIVSYALAGQHPERVRRLVLADCPSPDHGPADLDAFRERAGEDDLTDVFVPRDRHAVRRLTALAFHRPPRLPGFLCDAVVRELYTTGADDLRALLAALLASIGDGAPRPPRPRQPVLALWGRDDPIFPLAEGERLVAGLGASARLEVIDAACHAPNLEHPARFNALVEAFLR